MGASHTGGFVNFVAAHWLKFLLGAMGVGASWALLNAQVADKADKSEVVGIRQEISEIKRMLQDLSTRQREFFCRDQPPYCR